MQVSERVDKILSHMSIYEIIEMDDYTYALNIDWLHWNLRPGTYEEKYSELEKFLSSPESPLPPGAEWVLV